MYHPPPPPPPTSYQEVTTQDSPILPFHSHRRNSSYSIGGAGELLNSTSIGVQNGLVGGGYDRFPRHSIASLSSHRNSFSSDSIALPLPPLTSRDSYYSSPPPSKLDFLTARSTLSPTLLWQKGNEEPDDFLHEPDEGVDRKLDEEWKFAWKNFADSLAMVVVVCAVVGLFAGWPIARYVIFGGFPGPAQNVGWNSGGINGSGQVPIISLPDLWDLSTPISAQSRTGFDGDTYDLVFSDEFNIDGRTFWPGDDPFWEAVDLHYWATTDMEWYDPDAITTKNGNLEITLSEEPIHDLNFRSGMLQSWNKLCFTGGYIEVNMSLPGTPNAQGYWPGAWTMGNLGRAGYGATNLGTWPYSYNECDVGTLPNQTWPNGTSPAAAKHSGSKDYGGELSYLPGQRLSACTCPNEDHPGPNVGVGRGAPEIDIIEAQIAPSGAAGSASQSIQVAPFDAAYSWLNSTPYIEIWDPNRTTLNPWTGAISQESMSAATITDATSFEGAGYSTFGFEYEPGPDGRITWTINGTQTWQLNANAMGPNAETEIGQRLVSMEPMSIVLNLAISDKFQEVQWGKVTFPGTLRIDYVRIYQKTRNVGCNPPDYPTSDYINRHPEAYLNPNYTSWVDIGGDNYTWPKNKLSAEGCS